MPKVIPANFKDPFIQTIEADWLNTNKVALDVLRLDVIHPVISGNKWYKLQHYLQDAVDKKKETIATFGGAYSNHIVATAYAGYTNGLKTVGIIRGEKASVLSFTLQKALLYNMHLIFASREDYKDKEQIIGLYNSENWYWINEGGYGETGAAGASEILTRFETSAYTDIIASVGTGTMLAGLLLSAQSHQKITGISSMKGNALLPRNVQSLLPDGKRNVSFTINHDFHFGGYGKHPQELINYMNDTYQQFSLPLDIIYTAKLFYAINNLVINGHFAAGKKLLMIHSGGLQGNSSLPPGTLLF